jgi:hypothetical protein
MQNNSEKIKTFWIDTSITGLIFEDGFKEGTFQGAFGAKSFKLADEKTDNPLVAQMCKAAIRSAVVSRILSKGMPLNDVPGNEGGWTNAKPGVSFAVQSPVNAGQRLCVTVTAASCFPGSIHPAPDAAGQPCDPEQIDAAAEPKTA